MPNIQAAKKSLRQTKKRTARNNAVKNKIEQAVRSTKTALKDKDVTKATADLRLAIKLLDKAAGKGTIKKNNAARRKSRLLKALHKAKAA